MVVFSSLWRKLLSYTGLKVFGQALIISSNYVIFRMFFFLSPLSVLYNLLKNSWEIQGKYHRIIRYTGWYNDAAFISWGEEYKYGKSLIFK